MFIMRILITGATGFVGKTLVPFLIQHGFDEICLLIRSRMKADRLFPNLKLDYIDTTKNDWSEKVIAYNPDSVVHLATLFTGKCDAETALNLVETNVLFTTLLLEALSHTECRHFVNAGTFSEFLYGGGEYFANNLYSATKTAVRPIIRYYQTRGKWHWLNMVIYTPYGRKNEQKKIIDFLADALGSPVPCKFSAGTQVLDFIHVDDMADFFFTLLSKSDALDEPYYQFHLGTGIGHSLREVGEVMERVSGKKLNADWGAYQFRPLDTMHAVAPIARNIELLDWRSKISLEEGLRIYMEERKS